MANPSITTSATFSEAFLADLTFNPILMIIRYCVSMTVYECVVVWFSSSRINYGETERISASLAPVCRGR